MVDRLMQELDKIKRNQARRLARKKYQSNKLEEVEEGAESGVRHSVELQLVWSKASRNGSAEHVVWSGIQVRFSPFCCKGR